MCLGDEPSTTETDGEFALVDGDRTGRNLREWRWPLFYGTRYVQNVYSLFELQFFQLQKISKLFSLALDYRSYLTWEKVLEATRLLNACLILEYCIARSS